ncbi:MAG: 50S ribosomal protein L35, partial [Puniceicoccaceae bacterium]
ANSFSLLVFPMIKTRKSIAKKFKVTGTGKVLRRTAGKRHFLRNKTVKQKRRMSQDKSCSAGVTRFVKIGCPNKF